MTDRSEIYRSPYRNIIIPLKGGHVAVSFSGGADCTILVYILLKHGIVPTLYHENTHLPDEVLGLVYGFDVEFGVNIPLEFIQLDPLRTRYGIMDKLAECDCLYTGVTQNPPKNVIDWGPKRPLTAMDGKYEKLVAPFVTFDKRAPLWLYYLLGQKDLLARTVSCADGTPSCGKCFHCIERNWATAAVEFDFAKWQADGKA